MTGPTHKQYSITYAFILAIVLQIRGMTPINYYLTLPIIIQIAKYGALFPDVDHHWANVRDKTVPNKIINLIIRGTGGKHRSWHTHSLDIMAVSFIVGYYLPIHMYKSGIIDMINKEVMTLIILSFNSGWLSHMVADMMTSGGVRITCFHKKKVRLVPRSIGKLKFNTGNEWEAFVFKCTRVINIVLGTIVAIYPIIERGI